MKGVFALVVFTALLSACGGEKASVSTASTASTSRGTPATPTTAETTTSPRSPFADVVPEHSLRRIRLIEDEFSAEEPRLADGVRAVSGIESKVRCWTRVGWRKLEAIQRLGPDFLLGLADPFTYEIHLHPSVCEWLDVLLAGRQPERGHDGLQAAQALIVLTHEGTHFTSAGSNEAVVECRALQNAHKVAARLGIDEDYARRLARAFWEEGYPLMDPYYRSTECRDGGIMDVNPDTAEWP